MEDISDRFVKGSLGPSWYSAEQNPPGQLRGSPCGLVHFPGYQLPHSSLSIGYTFALYGYFRCSGSASGSLFIALCSLDLRLL